MAARFAFDGTGVHLMDVGSTDMGALACAPGNPASNRLRREAANPCPRKAIDALRRGRASSVRILENTTETR